MSALVLVFAEDLMFTSRIREAAKDAEVEVVVTRDAQAFAAAAAAPNKPVLVLADLDSPRLAAAATVAQQRASLGAALLVGFFSHVHVEASKAARAAGFHKVLARSAFVQELPELLRKAAASA
jgi:DNA-binding NarL/FixJ family response regulator